VSQKGHKRLFLGSGFVLGEGTKKRSKMLMWQEVHVAAFATMLTAVCPELHKIYAKVCGRTFLLLWCTRQHHSRVPNEES
jgi:hypothetical protein